MMKKKKIPIILCALILIFTSGFGYFKYREVRNNEQRIHCQLDLVYRAIPAKGINGSPLINGWTVKELLQNPPPVTLDGSNGLYIKSIVYTLYTGDTVDYFELERMMNDGEALEVFDQYLDYVIWASGHSMEIVNYCSAIVYAGGAECPTHATSSYEKYKKVIENKYDKIQEWYEFQKIPFGGSSV